MSETLREHDPDCLQKATGSVLRALRDEQGWSLDEASTHTNQPGSTGRGISAAWLSKIECGKKKLTPKVRAVLLELYGTDLATFEGRVREELERPPAEARLIVRPLSPPDTTTFGRDEAITEVTALLLAGEERCPRIVTLAGDGGSGKTRLAREVAWRLSQDPFFAGRVWWVPLETVTDRLLMAEALRDTLGLPQGAADPLGQVVRALASQPALIVLDNFERLVEAAAEDIQHLMACTDGLKLLVTSRRRLDLELERAYPILRLSVPEPVASVQELQSNPSVQMFMDRAGAKGVSILVSQANAGVLAHMCRCLEGIPQWIKLAAGRSDLLSPEQIAHSWSESRSLFTSNWRGDPERHQSIDAGIEWSCTLLSPETRSFLERLSVFRGPWTLRAAGAVGKAADPGKPLGELRCCYLIEPTAEAREGGLISDETRFEMLEPVRDYLHACLSQEERAAARNRHAEYYLDQATAAELHLEGSRKAEWLDQLDADVGNHRAALEWFQESGARESGLRLAGVLWWFWYGRCYWREGRKWLESFLDAPGEATAAAEARARTGAGTLAWAQDEYSLAEQHLTRAVELHRETADRNSLAWCLGILGNVARSQ
ncbi:MAG: AAA family ATPase [Actinomycetota bacterium]